MTVFAYVLIAFALFEVFVQSVHLIGFATGRLKSCTFGPAFIAVVCGLFAFLILR